MIVNSKIISRELHGETVLLNQENGDYFTLNKVGTEVFNYINAGLPAEEIIQVVFNKYDVAHEKLKIDIDTLITEMKEKNILIEE